MDIPKGFKPKQGIEEKTDQLMIGPCIKGKKEDAEDLYSLGKRFSIVYKNLTSEDLRRCNYPASTLLDLIIILKSESTRSYRVTYYDFEDTSSPKVEIWKVRTGLAITENEKEEFKKIYKQVFKAHSTKVYKLPVFKNSYFTISSKILDNVRQKGIADLLDNFYKPNFKETIVHEARFSPLSEEEIDGSNIPCSKIKTTYILGH